MKKKDAVGQLLYAHSPTPIALRWESDPDFRINCNEQTQLYFGVDMDHDFALEADRIAWEEVEAARLRGQNFALPSERRQERWRPIAPIIRSTQSGGSNTRARAGTEEERRAIAAVKGKGKQKFKGKPRGKAYDI